MREVPLSNLREAIFEKRGATHVAHLKGLTGAELRLEHPYHPISHRELDLVVIDPLTGKRKVEEVENDDIASI